MNKQNRIRLALSAFLMAFVFAASFPACDMSLVSDQDKSSNETNGGGSGGDGRSREISESEKNYLEKNGHFLKFSHMPSNTQIPNVFSVKIANSAAEIGKLHKNNAVCIFRNKGECTVYVPLSYMDDSDFLETGFFYVSFSIHVDALTKYVVELSDKLLIHFTDGRGEVDVRSLPEKYAPVVEPRYLTILNLPPNLSARGISNVSVFNQKETAAECADYSRLEISLSDGKAAARIPLSYYNMKDSVFVETGTYFVSFDINIDADTRFLITKDARVQVPFDNGNGELDINNLSQKQVPYLTIFGLPYHTEKKQITNIGVYNLVGMVAVYNDANDISITKNNEYATANIPLSSATGDSYFSNTGRFAISFTVNVDAETQISFKQIDNVTLQFIEGSAAVDVNSMYGYFDAVLTNASVSDAPIIKDKSSFDINGYRHTISSDTPVTAYPPMESCFLYLYAFRDGSAVYYEYSKTQPVYSVVKKGWYNDNKRALWKMIYIHDEYQKTQYLFKTYIADDFPHRETFVLSKNAFNSFTAAVPKSHFELSGEENPPVTTVTLQKGVYVINLIGAGGGKGAPGVNGNSTAGAASNGGAGGTIAEILTLQTATTFYAYTGSGGEPGTKATPSGTFGLYGISYHYVGKGVTQSGPSYWELESDSFGPRYQTAAGSGGGGAGGGSGTFLYSEKALYFLCAAGGGGGSGGSYFTAGGAGGMGGIMGPGSGGGAAGYFQVFHYPNQSSTSKVIDMTAYGGHGGSGGGYGSPDGGKCTNSSSALSGSKSPFTLPSNTLVTGAFGASAILPDLSSSTIHDPGNYSNEHASILYLSSFINLPSGHSGDCPANLYLPGSPMSWLHSGVSGQGGASQSTTISLTITPGAFNTTTYTTNITAKNGTDGLPGGNNRNEIKGGGAPGGSVNIQLPDNGSPGSITIYKIY